MLSESARMSSAAEARFRIDAANSLPRVIKMIALDRHGEAVLRRLAGREWQHTHLFTAANPHQLRDLSGRTKPLDDEIATADLIVLLAGPGGAADAAPDIGRACSDCRVMTTAFLVDAAAASDADIAKTLAQVRPWSLMVVIARQDEYLDDMMSALRAG